MRVNREEFLFCLECMQAGTNQKDIIEQSSCYVFKGGMVYSYNEETACKMKSGLDESFEGAVPAQKVLETVRKLEEEVLLLEQTESHLVIKAKKQGITVTILREKEIHLPINLFESAESWTPIDEDFPEAVKRVGECTANSEADFVCTLVHVHPEHMEAYDKFQFCRWKLKSHLKKSVFLRREAIRHVSQLGAIEIGETASWVHFKTNKGMILSCRRYEEPEYADITQVFEMEGSKVSLPKGLSKAISIAEVFTSENAETNVVHVDLKPGKLRLRGQGVRGTVTKLQSINYDGPSLSFIISPKMLTYIIEKFSECEVDESRLKVDGVAYQYVTVLVAPKNGDE